VNTPHSSPFALRRLAGAGAILVGNQLLGMGLLLFAFSTIQHTFSKADNGTFFWIQQISGFAFLIVAEMGMNAVVTRLFVEQHDNPSAQDHILTTFFYVRFVLWCISALGILGFVLLTEPSMSLLMMVYAMYLGLAARGTLFRSVLEMRHRARNAQLLPALAGLLDAMLLCGIIVLDRANLTPFRAVVWFTVSAIPGFVIMLLADAQWRLFLKPFDMVLAKRLVRESMPIFLSLCLLQLQDKVDTIVLDMLYGRETLGAFSAIIRVIAPSVGLLMIIAVVMAPAITRFQTTDPERSKFFVLEGLKITLLAALACAVALGALSEEVLWLTAGTSYLPYTLEFAVGAWTLIASMAVAYMLAVLTALGKQREALPMMLVQCVIALVGNILLTPNFGILGALVVRIISAVVAAALAVRCCDSCDAGGAPTCIIRFVVLLGHRKACCGSASRSFFGRYFSGSVRWYGAFAEKRYCAVAVSGQKLILHIFTSFLYGRIFSALLCNTQFSASGTGIDAYFFVRWCKRFFE
jgi:O-antigen/teichoic acid export membrane protein